MPKGIRSSENERLFINKGKLRSLNVYEVTESELENLERGGSDSILLNFAIFSFSVAISFLATLLTTKIESDRVYMIFFIVMILGFFCGVILLVLWWKNKISMGDLIEKIRRRIIKK